MRKNVNESKNVNRKEIIWTKGYDVAYVTFGFGLVLYVVQRESYWTIAMKLNSNLIGEIGMYASYDGARDALLRLIKLAFPSAFHTCVDYD